MRKIATRVKGFVVRHKTGLIVGTSFAAGFAARHAIHNSAVKDWNEFLAKHDLFNEFYTPEAV